MEFLLIAAVSLDGRLADGAGRSFSSPEDKKHFFDFVQECDGAVFGANTYRENPPWMTEKLMPGTPRIVVTRDPGKFADRAHPGLTFLPPDLDLHQNFFARHNCRRIAVLGGGFVYASYLAADRVDRIYLTLEPIVLGEGPPFASLPVNQDFRLVSTKHLNASTLLLEYTRQPSPPPVG